MSRRYNRRRRRYRRHSRQVGRILQERLNILLGLSTWHTVRRILDRVVALHAVRIGKSNGQARRKRVALMLLVLLSFGTIMMCRGGLVLFLVVLLLLLLMMMTELGW